MKKGRTRGPAKERLIEQLTESGNLDNVITLAEKRLMKLLAENASLFFRRGNRYVMFARAHSESRMAVRRAIRHLTRWRNRALRSLRARTLRREIVICQDAADGMRRELHEMSGVVPTEALVREGLERLSRGLEVVPIRPDERYAKFIEQAHAEHQRLFELLNKERMRVVGHGGSNEVFGMSVRNR